MNTDMLYSTEHNLIQENDTGKTALAEAAPTDVICLDQFVTTG
jgi:hypothetical protein